MSSIYKIHTKQFVLASSDSSYRFRDEQELEYMSLTQHEIQPCFPRFAANLAEQNALEQEQGRCAVVDFSCPEGHHTSVFSTGTELHAYLKDVGGSPPPYPDQTAQSTPRRRLFILEDLPLHHVLTLGSRLRIPPSFFAGHWDDPSSSSFNHRNPFRRCTLPNFRLRYATSNRIEIDTCGQSEQQSQSGQGCGGTATYAFNSRVRRYLQMYKRNELLYDEPRSHHALSFWRSLPRADGSWDALLLVDPPLGTHVRCLKSRKLLPVRTRLSDETAMPKHFLNPEVDLMDELPQEYCQWASSYSSPSYTSMFDDTLKMLDQRGVDPTRLDDPMSTTEIPRLLVVSQLIAFLRRRYINLVGIQNKEFRQNTLRQTYLSNLSQSTYSRWNGQLFDFITGSSAAMKILTREMEDNMISLGLDSPNCNAPQWERDGWISVKELCGVVEQTVGSFASAYLSYVTLQEAHVSGGSAQSLSRITVMTMLFIPLSTVASILSMSGDFLPGESNAWVFWAVAIPLLAVLAYLYWYRVLLRSWRGKGQRNLLPFFEKKLAKT